MRNLITMEENVLDAQISLITDWICQFIDDEYKVEKLEDMSGFKIISEDPVVLLSIVSSICDHGFHVSLTFLENFDMNLKILSGEIIFKYSEE